MIILSFSCSPSPLSSHYYLLYLLSISSLSPNLSLSISFSHFLYVIISIFLSLWVLSLFFSLYLIPSLSTPQLVYLLLHTFTLCLSLSHSVFLSVAASFILCPHSFFHHSYPGIRNISTLQGPLNSKSYLAPPLSRRAAVGWLLVHWYCYYWRIHNTCIKTNNSWD